MDQLVTNTKGEKIIGNYNKAPINKRHYRPKPIKPYDGEFKNTDNKNDNIKIDQPKTLEAKEVKLVEKKYIERDYEAIPDFMSFNWYNNQLLRYYIFMIIIIGQVLLDVFRFLLNQQLTLPIITIQFLYVEIQLQITLNPIIQLFTDILIWVLDVLTTPNITWHFGLYEQCVGNPELRPILDQYTPTLITSVDTIVATRTVNNRSIKNYVILPLFWECVNKLPIPQDGFVSVTLIRSFITQLSGYATDLIMLAKTKSFLETLVQEYIFAKRVQELRFYIHRC